MCAARSKNECSCRRAARGEGRVIVSRTAVMFEVERRTFFGRAMMATDARLFHSRVVIFGEVPAADSPRTGRAVGRKRLNAEQSREESTTNLPQSTW